MFRKDKAHAKIDNGRLILSMPNAETPALWMLDLSDAMTSVIRVEQDKQGLYVLKKHGGKAASAETIGVYRQRSQAIDTLNTITKTLDNAPQSNNNKSGGNSKLQTTLIIILLVWFGLSRLGDSDLLLLDSAFSSGTTIAGQKLTAEELAAYDAQIAEIISRMTPEAIGMNNVIPSAALPSAPAPTPPQTQDQAGYPQSADDFLRSRQ